MQNDVAAFGFAVTVPTTLSPDAMRDRTYYDITALLLFCKHGDVTTRKPFAETVVFPSYANGFLIITCVLLSHWQGREVRDAAPDQ